MAYTAWSVVFGEQPTAAKWNQLGANDAGFKDGTNIDALAITNAKLASGIDAAKLSNPYKFSAWRTAALNVPASYGEIVFDTEDFDTGSNFSTSTGRFTAPVNGFYFFAGAILAAYSNGDHVLGGISKNNAEWKRFYENTKPAASNMVDGFACYLQLAAGNTVAYGASAGAARAILVGNSGKYAWFTGHLVSST